MARYALVDNGIVANVIEWDGVSPYPVSPTQSLLQSETLEVGNDPNNPPPPPEPSSDEPAPIIPLIDGLRIQNEEGEIYVLSADNDGKLHVNPETP